MRLGVSNIPELSRRSLTKEEKRKLEQREKPPGPFDPLASSDDDTDSSVYVKKLRSVKTPYDYFTKSLSLRPKGTYKVWQTVFNLGVAKVPIYLHAINDSKPVFRITNRYADRPAAEMTFSTKNDVTGKIGVVSVKTSMAHKVFRKEMGNNDQSDAKRSMIGLSAMYYKL